MNKPILLCITQNDSLGAEVKRAFVGSPFVVRFCQTPAGAITIIADAPISALLVDFHPIALDASAFLQVLAEADPAVIPLALCNPEDLADAMAAKSSGLLSDILVLPLSKTVAQQQACRVAARSIILQLANQVSDVTDRILSAEDPSAVRALLSSLLIGGRRAAYSSLSADLRLGAASWHSAIFFDQAQSLVLDSQINLLMRVARLVIDRLEAAPHNQHDSEYDDLSGVYNKTGLMTALLREVERTARYRSLLALIVVDVDGFGELNRKFGRQTGDRILKGLGNVLDGLTRRTDIIARVGCDEFCLLLPGLDLDHAVQAVARVRKEVGSWVNAALRDVPVSLSFGIAGYRGIGTQPEQLLSDAMAALTHARAHGSAAVGLFDGKLQIVNA